MFSYTTYGNYEISNICLESYPCQHYVIDKKTGNKKLLLGTDILALLDKENIKNITDTHFEMYRKPVNSTNNK